MVLPVIHLNQGAPHQLGYKYFGLGYDGPEAVLPNGARVWRHLQQIGIGRRGLEGVTLSKRGFFPKGETESETESTKKKDFVTS